MKNYYASCNTYLIFRLHQHSYVVWCQNVQDRLLGALKNIKEKLELFKQFNPLAGDVLSKSCIRKYWM